MNKMSSPESQSGIEEGVNDIAETENQEKVEVNISSEVGKDLGKLFELIKKKFNDPNDNWTPTRLETNSTENLAPIIRDLRNRLNAGGAAEPDVILQVIIDLAIEMSQKRHTKEDFVDSITNLEKVTPGSKFSQFNKFMAVAEQLDEKKETPVE